MTPREHFVLPGMEALDVGALPPGKARDLLVGIAPRIEERHAAHHKEVLAAADRTFLEGEDGMVSGLALFDL